MIKFFNKNLIDIKPYLKNYIKGNIPNPFKEFEENCDMNKVDNHIICTIKVFENLKISKYENGKYKNKEYLDFDKIIPIRNREDFSYELVEKYWGAMPEDDGVIESGIDDNKLVHIWFSTRYLPPIPIIEFLLSKYKKEIIWFTKKWSFDESNKSIFYYYDKNKINKLIEKDLTVKEQQEQEDNKYALQFFIPYHAVYYGRYVNCYAKDSKSKKFICSCQKDALKNKLKMFDDYLVHDYCLNDRKEMLLRYLGLPDYYENLIKEAPETDNYIDYYDLFNFEDKLCLVCNGFKIKEPPFFLKNGTSKFRQIYIGEIEKQYSLRGIVDPIHIYQGNYYLEELLTEKDKKTLNISNAELLKEIEKSDVDFNIEEEFNKFNKLSLDEQKCIKLSLHYTKNGDSFNSYKVAQLHKINGDFIDLIVDLYDKRLRKIKKEINDNIHEFDKNANDYKTIIEPDYGINIWLKRNEEILHIELYSDVIIITETYKNKNKTYDFESSLDLFSSIMEILSSYRMDMVSENNTYEEWIICNGKRQNINEKDGLIGCYCSVAIAHSLIYLKTHINDNKNIISNIIDNWI